MTDNEQEGRFRTNEAIVPLSDSLNDQSVTQHRHLGESSIVFTALLPKNRELPSLDQVPDLFTQLKGPDSAHVHKYSDANTVFRLSCDAEDTPESERTPEQVALLADIATLEEFTYSSADMQYVYNPAELHSLVERLQVLRQKNRPDFDGVEGQLVDFVLRNRTIVDQKTVNGIVKREREDASTRRGMQWSTLRTVADASNVIMAQRLQQGSETRRYVIRIDKDPDISPYDKKPNDLRSIYQFVALSHAFLAIDDRNDGAGTQRTQTFLENAEVIEQWYEQARPGLEQLPTDHQWFGEDYKGNNRKAGAKATIDFMVNVLRDRRDGDEKVGVRKSYRQDPVGAINAQLRLGHTVEEIRAKLSTGMSGVQEEIIPLDI